MTKIMWLRSSAVISLSLFAAACGGGDDGASGTESAPESALVGSADLVMTPIDLSTALRETADVQPALGVCPWVSDATALASVDDAFDGQKLQRRAVTADRCTWNVNIGFALNVRATPISDARAPADMAYDMDNPPVVQAQSGPGDAAVALLDPTWDADNPRPYAFVFNAEGQQFEIMTTGVKTSIDRLRSVADEIASKAPTAQPVQETAAAEPTLDPCVYDGGALAVALGGETGETIAPVAHMPTSSCNYKGYIRGGNYRADVSFGFRADPIDSARTTDEGYALADGFDAPVYVKDNARLAGFQNSWKQYRIALPNGQISVSAQMGEESFPDDRIASLLRNLIARAS